MVPPPQNVFFKAEKNVNIPTKDLLSWMFDDVPFDEDKPIYIDASDTSRNISSREARTLVRKLVAGFRAADLKTGDCVCLHALNDIFYPIVFLGVVAAGGVWAGTNPAYSPYELSHHFRTSRVKYILTEPDDAMFNNIITAARGLSIPNENILVFDVIGQSIPAGYKSWNSLFEHGESDWIRFDDLGTCRNTTAARLYSSGTTGLPKAAELSHYNLIAQHTVVHERAGKPWEIKRLLATPFFHAATVPIGHTSPLRSGHVTYVMRRYDLESLLGNFEKYEIPELYIVPPIVIATINSPLRYKYSLKKAFTALSGGSPLDKLSQQRFTALMAPGAQFTQAWGMTETSCTATTFFWPERDDTGSVGRFVANLDAKLVDETGKDISGYDVQGELCVRGPTVFKGYFENPTANAETFRDGWFHTGDIAYCASGSQKWYLVDRKKELIKVRGFQVQPLELESVLLSHPLIVDAAIIGVYPSRADNSEVPRAYVVRRPGREGRELTEEAVKSYLQTRLTRYKWLDGGVVFVDIIPKTPSGKILKKMLREQAKREIGAKV